jgi:hypothetical protein
VEAVGKGGVSCGYSSGGSYAMGKAKRRWPWSKRGRHGRCRCSDRAPDGWAPTVSDFSNLSKTGSTLKIKMGALYCSKDSHFLHVTRFGYYEQFSQLCQHSIPNRDRHKDLGTDSTFEFLMNFKRDLVHLEKFGKFPKNPS